MTQITATASGSSPITAAVSGSNVSASVGASNLTVTVGGGIGPPGAAVSNLADLHDVAASNIATGDILRRSGGNWVNYAELSLLDGGNY